MEKLGLLRYNQSNIWLGKQKKSSDLLFQHFFDILQQRNKPKEAPKVPKLAPFFLPTVANENGFTFKNSIDANNNKTELRKSTTVNLFLSDFASKLAKTSKPEDCKSTHSEFEFVFSYFENNTTHIFFSKMLIC